MREPSKAESLALWKEVWKMAGKEERVKKEVEKPEREANDFKAIAQEIAHSAFLAEIRPLKEQTKSMPKGS